MTSFLRKKWLSEWPLALMALVLGAVYCYTAPRALPEADAGEFIVIAKEGGIAHPPGYPLYLLFLRLAWTVGEWFEPQGNPVFRLSVLSITFSVCAAVVAVKALEPWCQWKPAALLATGTIFLAAPVWRIATTIEPFALNLLLAALVMHNATAMFKGSRRWKDGQLILACGLLYGLGASNHHTLVLLVPLSLGGITIVCQRAHWSTKSVSSYFAGFVVAMVVGLLPYLYLFLPHDPDILAFMWGRYEWSAQPWTRLKTHFLRQEYGTFQLTAHKTTSSLDLIYFFLRTFVQSLSYVFVLVGALVVARFLRRPASSAVERIFWLICVVTFCVGAIAFKLLFNVTLNASSAPIVERFYGFSIFLFLPLVVAGLDTIRSLIPEASTFARPKQLAVFLGVCVILHAAIQSAKGSRRHETFLELHLQNVLTVARDSVFVVGSDHLFFGIPYMQRIHNFGLSTRAFLGQDVDAFWVYGSLAKRMRWPLVIQRSHLLAFILAQPNTALYTDSTSFARGDEYWQRSYPIGPIFRIVANESAVPPPNVLFAQNEELYTKINIPSYVLNDPDLDSVSRSAITDYVRVWFELANTLDPVRDAPQIAKATEMQNRLISIAADHATVPIIARKTLPLDHPE